MSAQKGPFGSLRVRTILDILIGDKEFDEIETTGSKENIIISMPYLSGPTLCDISNRFGLSVTYKWGGAQSRWEYLDDLVAHCIANNQVSDLLLFLFSKEQFADKLEGHSLDVIESAHVRIVDTVIDRINGALNFGDHELVRISGRFIVRKIGAHIRVATPAIKMIDRNYIVSISERAMQDVLEENYDSAITKSRTLLEEVFCYVIEKKDEAPSGSGNINRLYNQVKLLYNMHQSKDIDKRINGLLSGLEKILSTISQMRNKGSDSHGVGAKRVSIREYHARLFVNSAMIMADFILSVGNRNTE